MEQAGNLGEPDRQTGSAPSVPHRDLDGVHVLVVEDTDDSREVLRAVLEYCGALVTTAASAEEAKSPRYDSTARLGERHWYAR